MSSWWNKYKRVIILIIFVCLIYLFLGNPNADQNKLLDEEKILEIDKCIKKNNIAFSKEIFEEGAEEDQQLIKDDIDRVTKEVISLCT
jgi:hypothetical protein